MNMVIEISSSGRGHRETERKFCSENQCKSEENFQGAKNHNCLRVQLKIPPSSVDRFWCRVAQNDGMNLFFPMVPNHYNRIYRNILIWRATQKKVRLTRKSPFDLHARSESSHGFLSAIFGILGKFRIDIGENYFQKKIKTK